MQLISTPVEKVNGTVHPADALSAAGWPAQPLTNEDQQELLAFLAVRPLHTIIMAGWVRENGVVSPLNRGTFYAYRNREGVMEGVALIGHASIIEARSQAALEALAHCAQTNAHTHVIIIEHGQFNSFWSFYADGGQRLRRLTREWLFEMRWPALALENVPGLRLATLDDLDLVLPVHAEMVFEQSQMNPLQTDPQGFRERIARRIEQGRLYVWIEDGQLIFKTDIMAETPEMMYLEGVWVSPRVRRRGYGLRCISQVSRLLLARAEAVCVFASESNQVAQAFYRGAGYRLRGNYQLIYLDRNECERQH